jgi:6,7-dimethyl-8-ribityllumazine synthase
MAVLEGRWTLEKSWKFAVVVSRFNALITSKLEEGALFALQQYGATPEQVDVVRVPGAFEIPLTAKKLAESGKYQAVICLGTVIRGETPHFDQVVSGVTSGVMQAGLQTGVPVIYGVLTTETVEQAMDRAGVKLGNKGSEAVTTALEMVHVLSTIS